MEKDMDEILEYIENNYTPVQLIKTLDLDIGDLIVSLEDHIQDNREIFEMEILGLSDMEAKDE